MKRQRKRIESIGFLAALLATGAGLAIAQPGAARPGPATEVSGLERHDDCVRDEECVAITSLQQSCRHVDPAAPEVCAAVNRKYAPFLESVACYTNSGCRPITDIGCRQGVCTGTVID